MPRNPFIGYRTPSIPNELSSVPELSRHLNLKGKEYRYISVNKFEQYKSIEIPKRSGGVRLISAPNSRLKFFQRRINLLLQPLYSERSCVHGFVSEKSALTNAQEHLGRKHIVKIDLKDYFGQVSTKRVEGVLRSIGLRSDVSRVIANLCTLRGSLPQGAPTSPTLANMVTFRLDRKLVDFSKTRRLRYSRYADDLVFSSYSRPRIIDKSIESDYAKLNLSDLDDDLLAIFQHEGFELNEEKLYYCGRSSRRTVTGYTINERVNVPRRHVRRIRATLHNVKKNGYDAEQRFFSQKTRSIKSLSQSLRGQIEWIAFAKGRSDPVFRSYAEKYNKTFSHKIVVGPDLSKLADLSTWVLETSRPNGDGSEPQGTAFFLEGVGLVTAAHCVPDSHKIEVFRFDLPSSKFTVTVDKKSDLLDLAILKHSIPQSEFLELQQAKREPNIGEETILWGFPGYSAGHKLEERRGRVVSHPVKHAIPLICVDQKINQGNSGGPLLNSEREVVGIAHKGGPSEAQDLAVKVHMFGANWV